VLHVLQQLGGGLLSVASVKAKPADYRRYAQPATVNPPVYSTNRPAKERSSYAFWQKRRSAIIEMFRQEEDITEKI